MSEHHGPGPRLRPRQSPDAGLVGAPFPDLELPDHDGITRRLSWLADGDPLVLQTFRGPWCPKEQTWFRQLVPLQDEADVAYTRDGQPQRRPTRGPVRSARRARRPLPFLSDTDRAWLDVLGLRETTDTTHDPYGPYVFVLLPDLTISAAWNGYWYWGRPTLEELRLALRLATRQLRSDWEVPGS